MKRLFILFSILIFVSCSKEDSADFTITRGIPANTQVFISSPDLSAFSKTVQHNNLLSTSSFPLKTVVTRQLEVLEFLNISSETGISYSNISSENPVYTIITKKDSSLINFDSIQNKAVENLKTEGSTFKKISLEGHDFFLYESHSTAYLSNSQQNILKISLKEDLMEDPSFNKAFSASDPAKTSIFIKQSSIPELQGFFEKLSFPGFRKFASWSVLDLEISKSAIRVNGLSLKDSEKALLNIFSNSQPKPIEAPSVTPEDIISFYAISFSEFKTIHNNYSKLKQDSTATYHSVLNMVREISSIETLKGRALILNAIEIEAAKEQLAGTGEFTEEYRNTRIFKTNQSLGFQTLFPELMTIEIHNYFAILDHFIIFSKSLDVLRDILNDVQSGKTLAEHHGYKEAMNALSSESSLLFLVKIPEFLNAKAKNKNQGFKNSFAALQVITEEHFAHLHGILSETNSSSSGLKKAEQIASFKTENTISGVPAFFRNHRSDQMDIVVQDEENKLYLMSNKGNVYWKKDLKSILNGNIHQVDLFRNGNKQMAFTTGYDFEVLDRNGKPVEGFPITFKSPISQPLSVFDYDNNRNYRFVLTQNNRIYMVGPKGKAIKGFDFERTKSDLSRPPKHIRLGTKDYILITESSGKLSILNRQGKIRVPVTESFELSDNEWYGYNGNFVTTNSANELIKISQQGVVKRENLNLADNHKIIASEDHLVILNENELRINGNTANLDFGLYHSPQLFKLGKRTLIAITDSQAQKVYVFDSNAKLLEGFPVYGTSQVDIANADLDSRLELIVKGEENEVLLYKL